MLWDRTVVTAPVSTMKFPRFPFTSSGSSRRLLKNHTGSISAAAGAGRALSGEDQLVRRIVHGDVKVGKDRCRQDAVGDLRNKRIVECADRRCSSP